MYGSTSYNRPIAEGTVLSHLSKSVESLSFEDGMVRQRLLMLPELHIVRVALDTPPSAFTATGGEVDGVTLLDGDDVLCLRGGGGWGIRRWGPTTWDNGELVPNVGLVVVREGRVFGGALFARERPGQAPVAVRVPSSGATTLTGAAGEGDGSVSLLDPVRSRHPAYVLRQLQAGSGIRLRTPPGAEVGT